MCIALERIVLRGLPSFASSSVVSPVTVVEGHIKLSPCYQSI